MRVGFVLRSAEIKPLVPKICARKMRVHLDPPPQPPSRKGRVVNGHTTKASDE